MTTREYMGDFEQLVFLAIMRLRENAYGMTIRREIEKRTGRVTSLGAIYTTLDRLEAKGFISSVQAESDDLNIRQGNPRRFVKPEAPGVQAFNKTKQAVEAMAHGLELAGSW